ncbi:MAG: hypothetical protein J6S67_03480 [Methanobrevibacter sp.]|nr:hypothetical protein [Methanobrevibacter sp.]
MSKYTTEVRFICENAAGYDESKGFNDVNEIIVKAAPKIFNFDFPIFDESYRLPLETKILRHFYTREIGEETVGLWKLRMQDTLCNVMPYYNKLYESELITFNPLYDVDLTTKHKGSNDTVDDRSRDENVNGTRGTDRIESYSDSRKYNVSDSGSSSVNRESNEDSINSNEIKENKNSNVKNSGNSSQINENVELETRDLKDSENRNAMQNESKHQTGTDTTNGSVSHDEWNLYSDTPQGGLTGIERANDTVGDVAENAYLTNARHIYGNQNTTNNITGTVSNSDNSTINSDTVDRVSGGSVNKSNHGSITGFSENDNIENVINNKSEDNIGSKSGEEKVSSVNANSRIGTDEGDRDGIIQENVKDDSVRNIKESGIVSNMAEYEEKVIGKRNSLSYSKMLQEFRETFLNIDMMIIQELKPCFLNLW